MVKCLEIEQSIETRVFSFLYLYIFMVAVSVFITNQIILH